MDKMNIEALLEAAKYLETGPSTENGEDDSLSPTSPLPSSKARYRTIWSRSDDEASCREFIRENIPDFRRIYEVGSREVHNKLEKNRRAHLKECFELIKKQLPPGQDNKKSSHLSILHNAIKYIQVLRRKDREFEHEMERLAREKIALQQRLQQCRKDVANQWDNIDLNAFDTVDTDIIVVKEEPAEVKYSDTPLFAAQNIPASSEGPPRLISFTSRLEPVKAQMGKTSTLISPLHIVTSRIPQSSSSILDTEIKNETESPPSNNGLLTTPGRFIALSNHSKAQSAGYAHVVTPIAAAAAVATTHATIFTPVSVVSQGTQITQLITAPSSKFVTPFTMKPIMSQCQYLLKHNGQALVVRSQNSNMSQTTSSK